MGRNPYFEGIDLLYGSSWVLFWLRVYKRDDAVFKTIGSNPRHAAL